MELLDFLELLARLDDLADLAVFVLLLEGLLLFDIFLPLELFVELDLELFVEFDSKPKYVGDRVGNNSP